MTVINDDPTQIKQYITNLLSIIEEAVGSRGFKVHTEG